jgi:hypothetical protein
MIYIMIINEYEYLSLVDKVTATVATIDPISWQEAEA